MSIGLAVIGDLGFLVNDVHLRETIALDFAIGLVGSVAGLLVWQRRPDNRTGPLLVAFGWAWAISGIDGYNNPVTFAFGQWLDFLPGLILAHVIVAYPSGRLGPGKLRLLVIAGYSIMAIKLFQVMNLGPDACGCPGLENAFQVWDNPGRYELLGHIGDAAVLTYALTGVGILAHRWRRASGPARRILSPVLLAGALFTVSHIVRSGELTTVGNDPDWTFYPPLVSMLLIPVSFLYSILRADLERSAVGDLVIELGQMGGGLRDSLSRTLRDPAVEIAYWIPGREAFVDGGGEEIELPAEGAPRAATMVERGGERLAAIIHDRALLEDPRLVGAVSAVARLALDNERLHAEVRAQLDEVRASRQRIVQAGDAERRRVERDLHDGAQQRLLALSLSLRMAEDRAGNDPGLRRLIQETEVEARKTLTELRDLAQGIHPAILTEEGLEAAVETLAERAPVPVHVDLPTERFPAPIEATAYFVISEALANVAKYANASRVHVTGRILEGLLVIEIIDNGVGGATTTGLGSGLRGLEDRVAALDGRLTVDSPPGRGTTVRAEIPCRV